VDVRSVDSTEDSRLNDLLCHPPGPWEIYNQARTAIQWKTGENFLTYTMNDLVL